MITHREVIIQPKHRTKPVVTSDHHGDTPQSKAIEDNKVEHFNEFAYISEGGLKEGEDPYKRYAFNQKASERFRSDRNIMDTRHYSLVKLGKKQLQYYNNIRRCRSQSYELDELPVTSVIICFHNEARSALLRTVMRYVCMYHITHITYTWIVVL